MFGDFPSKDFPLLTKIVDARESLSIHVHPDNSYAYEHENGQYGKSECWYIIDAEEDAEIVIGTLAESREEVANHVQHGTIESILRYIKSKTWRILFYSSRNSTYYFFRNTSIRNDAIVRHYI